MTRTKKKHTALSALAWMRRDMRTLGLMMGAPEDRRARRQYVVTDIWMRPLPFYPWSSHGMISCAGSVTAALRVVRSVGTEAESAAAERAHAELVAALHATIRGAEPARGGR